MTVFGSADVVVQTELCAPGNAGANANLFRRWLAGVRWLPVLAQSGVLCVAGLGRGALSFGFRIHRWDPEAYLCCMRAERVRWWPLGCETMAFP